MIAFPITLTILCMIMISMHWKVITCNETPIAMFPLQFSAHIKITAHLIDEGTEYPPRYRFMTVYYDYEGKRARADIETGYEAAKTFILRYDNKNEYQIRDPPLSDCHRFYLGETMPFPDTSFAKYVGIETIEKQTCYHFLVEEGHNIRIHLYMRVDDNAPVRLLEESYENGVSIPTLSYDYDKVVLGPPAINNFDLPADYTHQSCTFHIAGFPYLHIFHHYVRF